MTDKDGHTRYFVGILGNGPTGKGPDFKDLNKVAGEIAPIVNDSKIVGLHEVQAGTNIDGSVIGPGQGQVHGLTKHDPASGATDIYIAFSPSGREARMKSRNGKHLEDIKQKPVRLSIETPPL